MNENEVELPEASNPNNPPQTNPEILPPSTRIMPNLEPERVNVNKENKNNNINNENKDEKEEFQQVVFMKPNSNYFFQIFLVIHSIYTFIYFILELIIFIGIKSFEPFLYGIGAYGIDIVGLVFYFFHQVLRFHNANFGNRTEHSSTVIMSNSIFVIIIYLYFWLCQSYVLRIEIILNIIGVFISLLEFIFLLLTFLAFIKQESSM